MKRKGFIKSSLTLMGGLTVAPSSLFPLRKEKNAIRFGMVSDVHYADIEPKIGRYYKDSIPKMREFVEVMNKEGVDFLIELGDFKDNSDPVDEDVTLQYLTTIEKEFARFRGPRYHVLGNHDEDSISKEQFLSKIENTGFAQAKNYYSFTKKKLKFIVLDANYTSEGVAYHKGNFDWKDCHIPKDQKEWLESELEKSSYPVVVFVHQRLDSFLSLKNYCPNNSDEIRKLFEESGKVLAVFQGHDHRGGMNKINNIPYYTIRGMITGEGLENNSFAMVEIGKDYGENYVIKIEGYQQATSVIFS